jgi:hypothetical protein
MIVKILIRPLGSLNFMRVWHDNTGWENYASWFVTAIVVRDVQVRLTPSSYSLVKKIYFTVEMSIKI